MVCFFVKFCCFSFVSHSHFALFSYNLTSCYFFLLIHMCMNFISLLFESTHVLYKFWIAACFEILAVWLFVFTCVIRCCCFFLLKDEKNGIHQQKKMTNKHIASVKVQELRLLLFCVAHGIAQAFFNVPCFFWLNEQQMTGRIGNYLDTHHWDNFSINKITNSYDQFWWMYCANDAQHQFIYILFPICRIVYIHSFISSHWKLLVVTFKTVYFVVCWDIEQRPIRLTSHSLNTIYY